MNCQTTTFEALGLTSKQGIWKCEGTTGTKFPEIDLVDKEWNDYDEKVRRWTLDDTLWFLTLFQQAGLPVGISEFESRFDRAH